MQALEHGRIGACQNYKHETSQYNSGPSYYYYYMSGTVHYPLWREISRSELPVFFGVPPLAGLGCTLHSKLATPVSAG